MKRIATLLPLLLLISVLSFAQTNPLDKKLARAAELYNENKLDEADEYLVRLLKKHPDFGDGWDMLVTVRGRQAQQTQDIKLSVTTKDKDGKDISAESDTLAQKLMEMLSKMSPSKLAMSKYMYTMRKAMLHSPEVYKSSMIWRKYHVDAEVDSNISRKAIKYYKEAEEEFEERNYASAAKLYRRAIEEQPDFYKARLYLGDAFYASENYAEAISSFQDAIRKFPDQLEPRKYLSDAYVKMKLYDKALKEAIAALAVYPDLSMVGKMDNAAYLINKRIDIRWTPREVFPNRIVAPQNGMSGLNEYSEEEQPTPSAHWALYSAALDKAKAHCDEKGIITSPSALDGSEYLELYSWQEMLRGSKSPALDEARKMQQAGFLDCYVLVTCFHPDIYDQYRHFVARNQEKVVRYFNTFTKDLE